MSSYEAGNIFARILRGEIPCRKLHEDEHTLAFHDINPQAPVHVLIIPKGAYLDAADFAALASEAEMVSLTRAIATVARLAGVHETGFRLISNCGPHSGAEVPHYHIHLLGGQPLGAKLVG